jgi:hypothetical protein
MEINLRPNRHSRGTLQTVETAAGNTVANLSNGSDKTYLFNFMDIPDELTIKDGPLKKLAQDSSPLIA